MSDEGLHEIQLNGKQLVFLFMTATVVAVVIFLCGVMVGRGVPAQRGVPVLAAEGADPTTPDDAARWPPPPMPPPRRRPVRVLPRLPRASLGLTYPDRLEEPEPVAEDVPAGLPAREPFATTAVAKVPPRRRSATAKPAAVEAGAAAATAAATAPGRGRRRRRRARVRRAGGRRAAARARPTPFAGRLARKGYPAFVTTASTPGVPHDLSRARGQVSVAARGRHGGRQARTRRAVQALGDPIVVPRRRIWT